MEKNQIQERAKTRSNTSIALMCVVFAGCMVGAAYAAVPLYDLFCRVTGYGGTTQQVDSVEVSPIDRMITINFDTNVASNLTWEFKPGKKQVKIQMGEVARMNYFASNLGNLESSGTATFNVTPFEAGPYFNKLECFCFTEQALKSGETIEMPVVFFVDPDMNNDPNLDSVQEITLSYTFFKDKSSVDLIN